MEAIWDRLVAAFDAPMGWLVRHRRVFFLAAVAITALILVARELMGA